MPILPPEGPERDAARFACRLCKEAKPWTDFYRKGDHLIQTDCKACTKIRTAAVKKADPVKWAEYARRWRAENPERHKATDKRNKDSHLEARREYAKQYGAKLRAENPEKVKATNTAYKKRRRHVVRAADARYREAHAAELRERHKAWRDANPERFSAIQQRGKYRRRAHEASAEGSHTHAEWEAVKARCDHTCLMCGRSEPEIKLTRDHIVPISKGGSNWISNIQGLCGPCNTRKHVRTLDLREPLFTLKA